MRKDLDLDLDYWTQDLTLNLTSAYIVATAAIEVMAKPQGRAATAEDVAQAILFLASDASASITGQVIHVNNGSYMP